MINNSDFAISLVENFEMNKNERERLSNLNYLYEGLIVQGYHHFIYGAAGSGKTTLTMHIALNIATMNPDMTILYFYLDGTHQMASQISLYLEHQGIYNIKILTTGTATEYKIAMEQMIKEDINLDKIIFIYDTFKFLTSDINMKNANKEAMHFIKRLTNKGATFISIGHSNKDGERQSGTAEIEQDSDALIRIDGIKKDNYQTSTIRLAGRCRMEIQNKSYCFKVGDFSSVEELNHIVNIDTALTYNIQEEAQMNIIEAVLELIAAKPLKQHEIFELAKLDPVLSSIGQNKLGKILKQYNGIYWQQEIGANNAHSYALIDKYMETK